MHLETFADLVGVNRKTVIDWNRRGKAEQKRIEEAGDKEPSEARAIYWRFWKAYSRALAVSEITALGQVKAAAARGEWTAAMTLMERRWPKRWGKRDRTKLEHSGPQGSPIQIGRGIYAEKVFGIPKARLEHQPFAS